MPGSRDNLQPANDEAFAFRRFPPIPSHWKQPPPSRVTSGAFKDREMSVDITADMSEASAEHVHQLNAQYIADGYGICVCLVKKIRSALQSKNIPGDVLQDPIENNEIHGIVTGEPIDKKASALQPVFELHLEPNLALYFEQQRLKKQQQEAQESS